MLKKFFVIGMLGLGLMVSGSLTCGDGQDVCDEAAEIIAECQNLSSSSSEAACEGVAACISQCLVDHPTGTCESLRDPSSTAPDVLALNNCSSSCVTPTPTPTP